MTRVSGSIQLRSILNPTIYGMIILQCGLRYQWDYNKVILPTHVWPVDRQT